MNSILENSHLNVWIVDPLTDTRTYCGRTSIPLIIFKDEKAQIILREIIAETGQSELEDVLLADIQIIIRYVSVGRRDLWENSIPYFTFKNCTIIRTWIPKLVASQMCDASAVIYFAEIESYNYSFQSTEEME